jgi:hypothetical protein
MVLWLSDSLSYYLPSPASNLLHHHLHIADIDRIMCCQLESINCMITSELESSTCSLVVNNIGHFVVVMTGLSLLFWLAKLSRSVLR